MKARKGEQKLKSISVLVPLETVQASLSEIGFLLEDTATIVADGKFWNRLLYSGRGDSLRFGGNRRRISQGPHYHHLWIKEYHIQGNHGSGGIVPLYECNEHQFVENIRRLIEVGEKFLVNRRITLHDDAKYGPATLPDEEFKRYSALCTRKSVKSTVYARVPFVDSFHGGRMYGEGDNLHSAGGLLFPRMSVPYYRVEYSVNVWGGTYFFTFDALFDPKIAIEKRTGRRLGREGSLVHVIKYNPPAERVLAINLPKEVTVFDVKHMVRVIDHSSNF